MGFISTIGHGLSGITHAIAQEVRHDVPIVGNWTKHALQDGYHIVHNVGNRVLTRVDEAAGASIGVVKGIGNNLNWLLIVGGAVAVVYLMRK